MGSTTIRATTGTATKRWDDPAYEPGTVAEAMEHLGVRGYVAHWFRSVPSELEVQGGDRTEYRDESRGRRGLDRAVEFVDSIADAERVHGYICPDSIETCSTELLRAAKREANRLGVRVVTKYGGDEHGGFPPRDDEDRSSLQHLDEEGVLDRPLLVMLDPPRTGQGKRSLSSGELEVLTRRDVTLGRVPQVAAREGAFADSISRFEAQGTAVGLGTGGDPPDPVAAMRCESAAGKAVERRADTSSSRAVFDAMTLGGARAVGRTDIGRLAPGSKADIVCVDFDRPHVGYVHDPIRALVNHCYGSDVDRVVVGGRTLVADGTVRALDASRMADEMEEATDAVASVLSDRESTDLEGDELFEQSYPNRSGGS